MGVGLETIFDIAFDETPYEAIFKCPMCGEEFVGYRTNKIEDDDIRPEVRKHECNDKNVGVATLIGFRYNPRL